MTLELSKGNLLKGLLQYNYFPRQHDHKEELPPIFNSEKLTPQVAEELRNKTKARNNGYDILPFKRTRHPNIPRMMGIPHPRAYAELVLLIVENWDEKISTRCQSPNSEIKFEVQDDFRIIVHKYDHVAPDGDLENQDPMADFGKEYRVKTDIANFYHSIYSHSLPWALVGHSEAKKSKNNSNDWFNQLDQALMRCQRKETKGIPIGPGTSSILSEIVLFQVDKALRENRQHRFSRYIDDYIAYVETSMEADRFLMDLTIELEKYALTLNPKKTIISKMPVLKREHWVTDLNLYFGLDSSSQPSESDKPSRQKLKFRQLKLIVEKAIALSREYPDGSVMKYAFSGIIDIGVDSHDAEIYLFDAFLKYACYFMTLIPLIQRLLEKTSVYAHRNDIRHSVEQRILFILNKSFEQGQSDNIVWCVYYLIQISATPDSTILHRCCETDDPIVILMGYVYAKKYTLDLDVLTDWTNTKKSAANQGSLNEYDIDRFWLVLYQLFYDSKIVAMPYKDESDNEVFNILKANDVSFVDMDHEDFSRLGRMIWGDFPVEDLSTPEE